MTDCALKQHATEYEAVGDSASSARWRCIPSTTRHPFISRDPSKCVLCGRCIRICLEVQGIGVFGYIYRGFASVVAPSFGVPFGEDATCISCGQCVSACPVGRAHGEAAGEEERAAAGKAWRRAPARAARWAAASSTAGTAASSRG